MAVLARRRTNSRMWGMRVQMKDKACAATARCFVVMFLSPADRVAPAPRMSCLQRELNSLR